MKRIFFSLIMLVVILSACNLPTGVQNQPQNTVVPQSNPPSQNGQPANPENPPDGQTNQQPVLLFTIGMHVEPFGETAQGIVGNNKGDYYDPKFFDLHTQYIRKITDIVAAHGGVMTIQVQSPYTEMVIATNDPVLSDLAAMGNEIALHFHEDAHLGKRSEELSISKWCEVMKQEINLIKKASGVSQVNYWSGGNLYPKVEAAAACAGLSINSDWKSPQTQTTDSSMMGIHPWRPAGGTDGSDFSRISTHDPAGEIVFLPEGLFDREDINAIKQEGSAEGDQAYFDYMEESLLASLAAADPNKVNVFHITVHPGEFRGDPENQFAEIDQFLTEVIDPLAASGQVQWATYSQMAEVYIAWEAANPGVDPRE